jgi:hypothetical protein
MCPGVPGVGDQPGGRSDLDLRGHPTAADHEIWPHAGNGVMDRDLRQPELLGYLPEEQPLTTTPPHGQYNVLGEASQRRKSGLALPAESPWRALRAGFAISSLRVGADSRRDPLEEWHRCSKIKKKSWKCVKTTADLRGYLLLT